MTIDQKRQYLSALKRLLESVLTDYRNVVKTIERDRKRHPENMDLKAELMKQNDKVTALETMIRMFPDAFSDELRAPI